MTKKRTLPASSVPPVVRCKHCQSDQMQALGPEMTILGRGTRYACQSCGQESIRVEIKKHP